MLNKIQIQENIPLADLTTFKIGGKARFFVNAKTIDEVLSALKFAEQRSLVVFILGGGSNVLVADKGFSGLVLQISLKGISVSHDDEKTAFVTAEAGEDWDEFVEFCVNENLAGLECLSGIPGFVGGTPIQNVGAYGQEVSKTIVSVKTFDRETKQIRVIENSECGFEYRKSIFNTTEKGRYIVLSVTYVLNCGGKPKLAYRDLIERFEGREPSLIETREAVREIRKSKGMLVRQGGLDSQSAGSFFKNPIVSATDLSGIEKIAETDSLGEVPRFEVDETFVKIPAAWLIEKSGFEKGFQQGSAGLSTVHTLALTNRGDASAKEVLELQNLIQRGVHSKFALKLTPEPNFIGFD